MLAVDGGFSDVSYLLIGDDYDAVSKKVKDSRSKGVNFVTTGIKKGNGVDITLDRMFRSLHQGDPYLNPGAVDRSARRGKTIGSAPFRLTGPTKKSCGSGTYFGTFREQDPLPHMPELNVVKRGHVTSRRASFMPRNIVTSPARRGTYGFHDTTLSRIGLNYIADFYEHKSRKAKCSDRKDSEGSAPFRTPGAGSYTFDSTKGTGTSRVYSMDAPMPEKTLRSEKYVPREGIPAWRPNNFRDVSFKPISLYRYMENPENWKMRGAKSVLDRKERKNEEKGLPWRPVSIRKPKLTRSIVMANLKVD